MNGKSKSATAETVAGQAAGQPPAIKERIFSIIRKASEEGITDRKRTLWIDFAPHIVAERREDGYIVWLWRGCVAVKIYLDHEFNVVGFDVGHE